MFLFSPIFEPQRSYKHGPYSTNSVYLLRNERARERERERERKRERKREKEIEIATNKITTMFLNLRESEPQCSYKHGSYKKKKV